MLVLGAVLLLAAACGDDGEGAGGSDRSTTTSGPEDDGTEPAGDGTDLDSAALDGRTFTSTAVTGRDVVAGSTITLTFTDGDLSVNAGCNTIGGAYTLEGGRLSFTDQPRSTMMGCDEPLMDQDTWLTGWLVEGVALTATDGGLTLDGDGIRVTFVEQAAEPAPLAGTNWVLDTLLSGETASSVPTGVDAPTLLLTGEGGVEVTTGCNSGGGEVTETPTTLTFGPLRLTMMACEGDAATVEAAVTGVLQGEVAYVIDGDRLELTRGDQGLVYRAAPEG